ncbi:MAG: site-specific integrase, partial [Oscillibacter sp.]|nr:site-specific integrase [Oscillibacter sp.]
DTALVLQREKDKQTRARAYYDDVYTQMTILNTAEDSIMDEGILSTDPIGAPVYMVMTRENGEFIQPRILQHVGRIIHGTYKQDMPVISADWDFHSLRHTHATALLEAGVPLAIIQKRLGHTNIEMTEHYTDHVTETMERDFQSKLKALYS